MKNIWIKLMRIDIFNNQHHFHCFLELRSVNQLIDATFINFLRFSCKIYGQLEFHLFAWCQPRNKEFFRTEFLYVQLNYARTVVWAITHYKRYADADSMGRGRAGPIFKPLKAFQSVSVGIGQSVNFPEEQQDLQWQ